MDFIDLLVDTSSEFLTGYFYKRRPKSLNDGRVTFLYKQLDSNSRVFNSVLGNVRSDSETYAIKTNDHCGFNVGGYVSTQNGKIWIITEVVTNEEAEGANEALRWFRTAKQRECSVRLLRVDNLFTEDTYSQCVVTVSAYDNGAKQKITSATIKIYDRDDPTPKNVDDRNKEFPYILKDNTLTFFAPQGVTATVDVLALDGGNLLSKKVRIDKSITMSDKAEISFDFSEA